MVTGNISLQVGVGRNACWVSTGGASGPHLSCAIAFLRSSVITLFSILKLVPNVVEPFAQNGQFLIRQFLNIDHVVMSKIETADQFV
jgi:hypothetical protein